MTPYLLSMSSYISGTENYLKTIRNLRDTVLPMVHSYDPQLPEVEGLDIYRTSSPYPGNLYRFADVPRNLDPDRMLIFTDTADVIFQAPIPQLENKIYVCPEHDTFSKHSWFHSYFEEFKFHDLDDLPIYNMGTWAMPVKKAYELIAFLDKHQNIFLRWWGADQPLYNLWLKEQQFEVHPSLMGCLYNGIWSGDIEKTEGKFYTKAGKLLSIVHANGSSKTMLKDLQKDD